MDDRATTVAPAAKTNGVNSVNSVNGINGAKGVNGIKDAIKPLNGQQGRPKKAVRPRRPGWLARSWGIAARLLTWYSILTLLFRCPVSIDACDDTSPRLCRPYFQVKSAVAPHLEPYYDAYAAPYIDHVRPYYHAVDQKIIAPAWGYARRHGGPRVQRVHELGTAQWEKSVQPEIEKYRALARERYDRQLAPHIRRLSSAFGPYYEVARTNMLQTYHEVLLPAYHVVQPHVRDGYLTASAFASNTVAPAVAWTWNKTYTFLDGTVGPRLRAAYLENVEPQLVKIGKRLGRYSSTGKKSVPKPPAEAPTSASTETTTSSFARPAASVTVTPSAAGVARDRPAAEPARTRTTMEPIPPPEVDEKLERDDPVRRTAREVVAADLRDWQERYAKAADEGAAEIDERVQEIAKKMIRRNARITGKALLEQLHAASVSELVSLRRAILDIVGAVNKGRATPDEGVDQIVLAVRHAGMAVRDRAQAVRTWREKYEAEMRAAVTKAAETHFTILENIRDLALQKIGMKWAWMDGVTYKDWAKYHLLKSRFDEWKGDLESHVVSHPSLEAAQAEGADIEDEAMKVAASTAKELARLKQVAQWKLAAGDDTAEFDSTLMQQAAEAVEAARLAAARAAEAADESARSAKDSVVDAVAQGASLASVAASKASEAVLGSEAASGDGSQSASTGALDPSLAPAVEASVALEDSQASPTDASHVETVGASHATDAAEPEIPEGAESNLEDAAEAASQDAAEPTAAASTAVDDSGAQAAEGTPGAQDGALPEASTVMFETPVMLGNFTDAEQEDKAGPVGLPVEDEPESDDHGELGSTGATGQDEPEEGTGRPDDAASVRPALFGAAAQSVPNRRPILDEDTLDDVSSAMESMRGDLKSAYTAAMSRANEQYSQALSLVSAQIRGTPEPAHERMLASVTSAYSKAMASASSRLDDALMAASVQIHGTTSSTGILPTAVPVPDVPARWSEVQSIASERLQQGLAWAEEQYESAKVAVGLATPTPSTPAEHVSKMLDNARHNYYAGIGLAHARYSEFLAAASAALSSLTATPAPTDVAGSASSIASAASESASSALSAASAGAASVAAEGYDKVAVVGNKVAEGWEVVVTRISLQVYGAPTPTPWYSSVYSAASEYAASATSAVGEGAAAVTSVAVAGSEEAARQYAAASSIVSELLVGKEPPFSESILSRLSAAYATGVASARSVGDKAASAVSKATEAAKDTAASIRDEL